MEKIKNRTASKHGNLLIPGVFSLTAALYQNIVLGRPYFYALFSLGMFLLLLSLYNLVADKMLFSEWSIMDVCIFSAFLLFSCLVIDELGMRLGYWEYPHYGPSDDLRKYFLEWAIALLYHMVSLLLGIKLFQRLCDDDATAFLLSIMLVVTPVGFLTESLNQQVNSWRVLSMPFTNLKIGDFFLVFQTVGYWLMALIPYTLYILIDLSVQKRRLFQENK